MTKTNKPTEKLQAYQWKILVSNYCLTVIKQIDLLCINFDSITRIATQTDYIHK